MIRLSSGVFLNLVPIIIMIGLIPIIADDFVLAGLYVVIILASLPMRYEKADLIFLVVGAIALAASEAFFISTGVETFTRQSLFGIMPLWLPVLWGYAFVVIRRSVVLLDEYLR